MAVALVWRVFCVAFEAEGGHELHEGREGGGHCGCQEAKGRSWCVCAQFMLIITGEGQQLQHLGNRTGGKALVAMG